MATTDTLALAIERLDVRRAEIEALVLADLEFWMIADPAPAGEMETVHHLPTGDPEGTANGSPFTTVVFS